MVLGKRTCEFLSRIIVSSTGARTFLSSPSRSDRDSDSATSARSTAYDNSIVFFTLQLAADRNVRAPALFLPKILGLLKERRNGTTQSRSDRDSVSGLRPYLLGRLKARDWVIRGLTPHARRL
ncbi:MAG: hypothetical protein QOJ40_1023 [Verrucomicrobiota bacterium]